MHSLHYRDYSWLQVLFVDIAWIQALLLAVGALGAFMVLVGALSLALPVKIVRTPPGSVGKAAALNLGITRARGDLIAVCDADARVAPDFLLRMVASLAGSEAAGAQSQRRLYNAGQNLLTRIQDDEYRLFYRPLHRARQVLGGMVSVSGHGMFLRRDVLQDVGGWNVDATGAVVIYIQLPRKLTTWTSGLITTGVLLAMLVELRGRVWEIAPVLVRSGLFSLHRLVVVPLAIHRYVRSAITGHTIWEKTTHGVPVPPREHDL